MKTFTLVAVALLTTAGAASAVVIVQYDTVASTTNATINASTQSSVSATALSTGGGLTANNGLTWNWRGWDTANTSFANAVAAGDFWRWGFTVDAGIASLDLDTFDIRFDRSGTGPDDVEIQATVNGGSPFTLLTHDFADSVNGVEFIGQSLASMPLLTAGDTVVFTLGAYNSESTAGTFDLEAIDAGGADPRSIRIEGTARAVPEPSSFLYLGLIGVGATMVRRWRQR